MPDDGLGMLANTGSARGHTSGEGDRRLEDQRLVVVLGVEAVAAWEAKAWDAILMDIHMPEMDGVTATSSIRLREVELGRDKTPIIAVTASVQPEQTRGYLSAGMDDCVPKPVETRVLVTALQGVLAA